MNEKAKKWAWNVFFVVVGIVFLMLKDDSRLYLWGVIPLSNTVVGVFALAVGVISSVVELVSERKAHTTDAAEQIKKFIKPNLIPLIIQLIIPVINVFALIVLLTKKLPILSRAKRSLYQLEVCGTLDKAAGEMTSLNAKHLIKGNAIFTENYLFFKGTGLVLTYDEVVWAYRHRFTKTVLFIPIRITDSLYLATKGMKPCAVASMGKDELDEITKAIVEIYNHNNNCLIGYTDKTAADYKVMTKK